jgi:methylthioribose-1-phosphate isomerase
MIVSPNDLSLGDIFLFSAMKFEPGTLHLVDQRLLPTKEVWLPCDTLEKVADAIEVMVVRGAPAIGCSAAYGLAVDAHHSKASNWSAYRSTFEGSCDRLARTRPTAVNLFFAIDAMKKLVAEFVEDLPMEQVRENMTALANHLHADDIATCKAIGAHGAAMADKKLRVLTHCNTGSLATAGYGTALGVIRKLWADGKLEVVYVDETRPYLQGARLTAFELEQEGIPYKLVADSVAAWAMQNGMIDWAIVGADRIASNGDTANKIGTYSVAVNAKHHGVKFFVAAPKTTFDGKIKTGKDIPVEERDPDEVKKWGGHPTAPENAQVFNPSFDVTPASLIDGIITEAGVLRFPYTESIANLLK